MTVRGSAPGPVRLRAALAALAIGAGTAALVNGAFALASGAPPLAAAAFPVFLFQAVMVAFPFLVLSVSGIVGGLPWRVAAGLTLPVWGYYLWDGLGSRLSGGAAGGGGLTLGLVLLASPAFIAFAAVAAHLFSRRPG